MKIVLVTILILFSGLLEAQASDPQEGYAIIRSDTIYGDIKINFDAGSILVKQDSINRMFLSDIKQVTLLNDERETFKPIEVDGKTVFYKMLVPGNNPLLEAGELYFTTYENQLIQIQEEKDLYDVFGKKDVKDYIFIRNIELTDKRGIMDVFRYFNQYESF